MLYDSQMCDKAINKCYFVFDSIYDWYKTQETVTDVFLKIFFLIVYYPDKYKTQIMCDKAVDDSPVTFKLTPDWFVISKMIKKFFTALYANENSFYFNEDFDNVVFFCNEICVLNVDPKNINLDNNF